MPTMNSYAHGQFNWVDLVSREMAGAKAFYAALFGWDAADQDTQGGPPYALFTKNEHSLCGLGQMNDEMAASGMPPMWNSYINVDDVDAACARVTELGGQITMPPMQVVDAGRMAGIQDPGGAFAFLWQAINHNGAQLANDPDTWVWNEVMTYEPDDVIRFYGDLFGWTFEREENSPASYWIIKNDDRMNGGMLQMTKEEFGDMPSCWIVYFNVADMAAALGKLKEQGGQVYREPFDSSVGPIAVVADNQGAVFHLIQLAVPPDE